jgi:hypothetical protein
MPRLVPFDLSWLGETRERTLLLDSEVSLPDLAHEPGHPQPVVRWFVPVLRA